MVIRQRLLAAVQKDLVSGCWLSTGQVSNSGYGRIAVCEESGEVRFESAHRASYEAFVGALASDAHLRHLCGRRLCINLDHLEVAAPDAG
jgi:hypothetical protein